MNLIDVSVPLDSNVPTYPGNTPFRIEPMMRTGRGDRANVFRTPGAPAHVVLRRS